MDTRSLLITVVLGAGVLVWFANRSAFFPMKFPAGYWEEQQSAHVDDVYLTASDGVKLHGWWKSTSGARAVALFLHGNAGNVTHRAGTMQDLSTAGASVLVIDYRGYGKSEGWPTERGLYRDAEAAYRHLIAAGWTARQIIIVGESLGSAVAIELASRFSCAGVVLEAPFPSARSVAARVLPVLGPALVWGFDSRARIKGVRAPLLFIQGDRDEVIPYELGRELYEAAPEPKSFWTVHGAHHNDIHALAMNEYPVRFREFMMAACNAADFSQRRP